MHRCCILTVAILLGTAHHTALAAGDTVVARAKLYQAYDQQLSDLADWCDSQELADQAAEVRQWRTPREPDKLYAFVLEECAPLPVVAKDASESARQWATKFGSLREAQAEAFFALAGQAMREHQAAAAYELVYETLRENPDHAAARRLLGFTRAGKRWSTPFEARQARAGKVLTEKFGWLPEGHVARYERGERFCLGRWMSAAEEAKVRDDIEHAWRIESAHYVVRTNHSLEAGLQLSRRLERLHEIWQQVFVRYLATDGELERWFAGRGAEPRDALQHKVYYYRSRQEYNDALRAQQPRIDMTLGIYFDALRAAYFFAGDDQDTGTLYHEATHQLFHESRRVAPDVGRHSNFWIVEGVACYMESLAGNQGRYTLGGLDAGRVPAARVRLLGDGFYVPLAQLVGDGMDALQQNTNLPKLYSQSAGLTTFLMHYQEGRYREPLVSYIRDVYAGRADEATLAHLTERSYETLDAEYRQFLQGSGQSAPSSASPTAASGAPDAQRTRAATDRAVRER